MHKFVIHVLRFYQTNERCEGYKGPRVSKRNCLPLNPPIATPQVGSKFGRSSSALKLH